MKKCSSHAGQLCGVSKSWRETGSSITLLSQIIPGNPLLKPKKTNENTMITQNVSQYHYGYHPKNSDHLSTQQKLRFFFYFWYQSLSHPHKFMSQHGTRNISPPVHSYRTSIFRNLNITSTDVTLQVFLVLVRLSTFCTQEVPCVGMASFMNA